MARILIVEDQPGQRELLARTLKAKSFDVIEAKDGFEGVEQASRWQPDLILMDLRMPRMDGIEAIALLRSKPRTASTPIMVLTVWHSVRLKKRACQAGATSFLTKPVDNITLMREVYRLLYPGRTDPVQSSSGLGL
jgi:CheY-like chemotaxis protein